MQPSKSTFHPCVVGIGAAMGGEETGGTLGTRPRVRRPANGRGTPSQPLGPGRRRLPLTPVWLEHRSGHASILNSRALQLAGICRQTPDPPGGVIERDPATGEPTGVLFEMRHYLHQRLGSTRSPQEFEEGMSAVGQLLNRYGITSVQDAGADNGIERWRTFRQLQSAGALSCSITMFAGAERLNEFAAIPSPYGEALGWGRPLRLRRLLAAIRARQDNAYPNVRRPPSLHPGIGGVGGRRS